MIKAKYLFLVVLLLVCPNAGAEDFLGAPVFPEAKVVQKTDVRMELKTTVSHDEVLSFYKDSLKDFSDIKFRNWKDATYIEDDGKLKWHSITIAKGEPHEEISIVIMKDNWTWIIGTLVLRFVGVFVVLIILLAGMALSGAIISRTVKRSETKKAN